MRTRELFLRPWPSPTFANSDSDYTVARDEFFLDETDLEILCPKCGVEMVRNDKTIYLEETPESATLECGNCGEISRWEYTLKPRRLRQVPLTGTAIPKQYLPERLTYHESPSELLFTIKWFELMNALPAVLIASALIATAIFAIVDTPHRIDPEVLLGGAVILAVLLYTLIAHVLNRTIIRVRATALSVEHTPVPWSWPLRREIPLNNLKELVSEKRQRNVHALIAQLTNGKKLILLRNPAADLAEFIVRRVNRFRAQARSVAS